ncbi:hypothetical protein N9X87_00445, partial [bacterium]|nr:hypothetical protein [bacterium]
MGQELVKMTFPDAPISMIAEARNQLERASHEANLVGSVPVTGLDFIPPMHSVSIRPIFLDLSERGDTYVDKQWCSGGERAMGKTGLLKVWSAANGKI